jgi:phosphoribosylformylglycinamidine synthase subunit PurQ / glutaminase
MTKRLVNRKCGIVRFPGTNCDRDVFQAVEMVGAEPVWLWHADQFDAKEYDSIFLPGGFSYGDYLRSGALASRAPVMKSVREAADRGTPVLGICNGFQILTEAQLLPGSLIRNNHLRFNDDWVELKLENTNKFFAGALRKGTHAKLPVAHGDGRYFVEDDELKRLQDKGQIWLKYEENPNGSINNIAGVMNEKGNVAALMPHPERAMTDWMGGVDGFKFFEKDL